MKKILVITPMPHYNLGGTEVYVGKLINIFKKNGYSVDEVVINKTKNKKITKVFSEVGSEIIDASGMSDMYRFRAIRIIKRLVRKNDYGLIVNCTDLVNHWLLKQNNHVLVQHSKYGRYDTSLLSKKSERFKLFLDKLFLRLGVFGDPFRMSKFSVFYTKEDNLNNIENAFYIPLSVSENIVPNSKGDFALWAGRISYEKGIDKLIEIHKEKSFKIEVYGSGAESIEMNAKEYFGENFSPALKQKKLFEKMLDAKVFLLTSREEGFGYVVAESLSHGTPVVAFDCAPALKFLEKSGAVFLIKQGDVKGFSKKVDEIMKMNDEEYIELSKKANQFSMDFLSDSSFVKSWEEILAKSNIS